MQANAQRGQRFSGKTVANGRWQLQVKTTPAEQEHGGKGKYGKAQERHGQGPKPREALLARCRLERL